MNPHMMQIQQMYGGHASPFAQARAKRQEQKASLTNPFIMPDQDADEETDQGRELHAR